MIARTHVVRACAPAVASALRRHPVAGKLPGLAMRSPTDTAISELDLLGWRREVFALYQRVRELEPEAAWREWRAGRDRLFATHPQTPLGADSFARFDGLRCFAYDPAFRVTGSVVATEPVVREIDSSTGERIRFRQFGLVEFELFGEQSLPLYWLEGYGGGVFLPFTDATSGGESYGGGRYLLDTVKGADLGEQDGRLVLDFNFAYNPSCAYDPRWTCPLPPRQSRLPLTVAAGEHTFTG
jgi:uncharacterized protein